MIDKNISTKVKIINAALEIGASKGLSNTSLSDIANAVGIKKASLYNHFSSREEIIFSLYEYLREMAKNSRRNIPSMDKIILQAEPDVIIKTAVDNYMEMTTKSKLGQFFKVVESEKYYDDNAARIILEETKRMHKQTKELLEAMAKMGKLEINDMETAVSIFANAIHEMMTVYILYKRCEENPEEWREKMDHFIKGFVNLYIPKEM